LKRAVGGKVHRIWNPVDDEFFELDDSEVGSRLLYGGGIRIVKNTLGLVRAFGTVYQENPQAELLIFGRGSDTAYDAQVRAYVSSNGLGGAVRFMGLVDQADFLRYFGQAALVCLFSHQEGSPTLVAQAMCAGKPVVVSAAGGTAEMVIDGETGFVVGCGDEAAFAQRSLVLLGDRELRRRMGQRAREVAEQRFRKEVVAAQTKAVYAQALSGK
jgi:glycosyltransferase involved in cell wall biosynthesis